MNKKLLYYNPNITNHPSNYNLPGIEKFSKFFKIFNPTVVFLDRTNTINIPFNVKSIFPIPEFRPMSKTYEEICNERASYLLTHAEKLGAKIYVFYSGGIDSTLLLISLLKNATTAQKSNIVVLLSEESIVENPNFYQNHIRGKLEVESASMFPYFFGSRNIFIGGEHNDQLFGSDIVGKIILEFGQAIINQPYSRDTFFRFFNKKLDNKDDTNFYLDIFERLRNAAPVPIETNFDYLWWINFSLKWQSVFMRMLSYVNSRNTEKINLEYIKNNYFHFYGTEDFQLWSMNNPDKKIKDSWNTYKWVCKDIIYDYNKDENYRDNKTKRGSLYFLLLQQCPYNFIDDSFKFYNELNLQDYYNPINDFV